MIIKAPSYSQTIDVDTDKIDSVGEMHIEDLWTYFIYHKKGMRAPESAVVICSQAYNLEKRNLEVSIAYNAIMQNFLPELRDRKINSILK